MRLFIVLLALVFLAPKAHAQRPERLFYYVDRETSYESFVANISQIDIIGPQVYRVDSLGIVWGSLDPRVKRLAAEHDVKVMPLLVNEGFPAFATPPSRGYRRAESCHPVARQAVPR